MMTLGEIIRANKVDVKIGEWGCGKIPPAQFPAFKRKFPNGSDWRWRVITFDALGHSFRLIVRLNTDKAYYSSILALENGSVIQIICHHELHLSHKNWHCHFITGDVEKTMPGVLRDKDRIRVFEAEPSKQQDVEFNVSEGKAMSIALERFRIPSPASDERQGQLL